MDLVAHPDNPIPAGATSGFVTTEDGRRIRFARFDAVGSPLKGMVTILQGRAEFIEKYFETVEDLRKRGFAVVAFDWRGQGGSERVVSNPRLGYVYNLHEYVRDAVAVLEQVSLPDCPGLHYGLCHSTGGLVALLGHVCLRTIFERMVLASPLIGLGQFGYSQRILGPLSAIMMTVGLAEVALKVTDTDPGSVPFADNSLTHDEARFARTMALLKQAPELDTGPASIGWLNAACRAMRAVRAYDFAPQVSLPLLFVAAGADRVVSSPATEELASRMRAAGYVEIPGARHELMMEANRFREQFWAAFDAFIPGSRE
ncbi:alpha/beta hydrolase [Breoghania sp.]|uniref:alpha/beta hydrolase n=1 Tax=Breoghania sp. TaxID=2065378 RepID=UPI0026283BD7|nr:alpha/beta hydrolase [Breoghania sp.]MDJ0932458.1 alpha/beta hydrolase [Breoghania sp.]